MVDARVASMAQREDREQRALSWLAVGLTAASVVLLWPFAPWVVLAAWGAVAARRPHAFWTRVLGDRPRIAAAVTLGAVALLVVPAVALLTLLVADAIALVQRLMASERGQETLRRLVSSDDPKAVWSSDLMGLAMRQGERAWAIAQQVAGTAVRGIIGVVVLIAGIYAMLIDGDRWYAWVERHAPIPARALGRLAQAFVETGRGLLFGIVGAGLAQSIVATVVYVLIGVPQPFALGVLTLMASVVPSVGTAIVWLPVATGLALTGRTGAALVLAIAGVVVIGSIDNLVRPYLARRGHLQLPTFVVLVAMFSGIIAIGAWGMLVAPLAVRLAKEALAILHDRRVEPAAVRGS
jgi:predicted PurR-regulated permease PerM